MMTEDQHEEIAIDWLKIEYEEGSKSQGVSGTTQHLRRMSALGVILEHSMGPAEFVEWKGKLTSKIYG